METEKRLRGRSKSGTTPENNESIVNNTDITEGTPPNLNGEKVEENIDDSTSIEDAKGIKCENMEVIEDANVIEAESVTEEVVTTVLDSTKPSEGVRTRKRKASEMKVSDDEKPNENEAKTNENNPKANKKEAMSTEESTNSTNENSKLDSEKANNEDDVKPPKLEKFEAVDDESLHLPPKETFGKGKRARVPNKRYSDIMLASSHKNKSENGTLDSLESDLEVISQASPSPVVKKEEVQAKSSPAVKRSSISSPTPGTKKTKVFDPTNPLLLKPFQFGWKRELVWRATNDNALKPMGDIYYYMPSGKKLRSMREVADNLRNTKLTLENFSFFKEPLNLNDSSKEIIRDAKVKFTPNKNTPKGKTKVESIKTHVTEKITSPKLGNTRAASGKNTPKVMSPKVSSPKVSTPKNASKAAPAEKETKTPNKTNKDKELGNFKIKLPPKKTASEKKKVEKKEEPVEVEPEKPAKAPVPMKRSGRRSASNGEKIIQPCSIMCQGVLGVIPTLQCTICLCLYHHQCMGVFSSDQSAPYTCKNCQNPEDQPTNTLEITPLSPPILTEASAEPPPKFIAPSPPKLQRIEIPTEALSNGNPITIGDITITSTTRLEPTITNNTTNLINNNNNNSNNTNKSLLGSVTSWLPHTAKIVENNNEPPPGELLKPQNIEIIGGRKFLVIPKHNLMTVSPNNANNTRNNGNTLSNTENKVVVVPTGISRQNSNENEVEVKIEPQEENKENEKIDQRDNLVEKIEDKDSKDGKTDKYTDEQNANSTQTPPVAEPKPKRRGVKPAAALPQSDKNAEGKFMDHYLQNLSYGYNTLLYVFQYLKVQDLLRAGCVCTLWRDIASHPVLWRTVRMKNSQVHSFEGLAFTLKKHGTVHLDLRKMLLPSGGDEIWPEFSGAIKKIDTLRRIELCRCPAVVVEDLCKSNPNLEVINAVTIKCDNISLDNFEQLRNIKELRLKATSGLHLTSTLSPLSNLTTMKNLSLTAVKELHKQDLSVLGELVNLETLDLGECYDFPEDFGKNVLSKLVKIERLRLEKGQGNCHIFEMFDAIKTLRHLEQLELVNFDVKPGFDKALGACKNIKKLLIIPTYISQSATTNHMVLCGVLRLHKTLSHFVWGVTLELLRVTELFVDQNEELAKEKKKPTGNGDSIPVLKPVPIMTEHCQEIPPAHDPPQVEILPLPNLQKLLLQSLPTTRVKILKIPFHATWRQSITDNVN